MERERAIADDAVAVARSIAGIAQIDQFGREAPPARSLQQPIDRRPAARLLVRNGCAHVEDGLRGQPVDGLRVSVIQKVRQVRTDHDQRFGAAPQRVEHLRDFVSRRIADRQRHQRKVAERLLQKRQMHFERMLHRMGGGAHRDLREFFQFAYRRCVDGDIAERGGERLRGGQRQTAHGHAMHRPEQHDALDHAARGREPRIDGGRESGRSKYSRRAVR